MSRYKRLYIITGKGGVGKTTIGLALTKHLADKGLKASYLNFTTSNLSKPTSDIQEIQLAKKAGIPFTALNLLDCCTEYVAKKMKSKTAAKWVVSTPFFKALISMIPGFNYLIYLGKALEALNNDEELIYVLDSPSSGHALTMMEATRNFGEIFQSGLLFDDTQKMIDLLYSEGFAQINILSLPTLMAANEGLELEESLNQLAKVETRVFCNNSFRQIEGIDDIELPPFLSSKIKTEEEIQSRMGERIQGFIAHSMSNEETGIMDDLVPSMDRLE